MAEQITVYGTDWCGDTRRALEHLDKTGAQYEYVNIDEDSQAEKKVIEFSKGKRRVPLLEIATETGTKSLCVPSASEIDQALGNKS